MTGRVITVICHQSHAGDGRGRKWLGRVGKVGGLEPPFQDNGAALNPDSRDAPALDRHRLRRGLNGAGAALATTDGRWALVSTSLTALVAGAIAWMAVGMMPVTGPWWRRAVPPCPMPCS